MSGKNDHQHDHTKVLLSCTSLQSKQPTYDCMPAVDKESDISVQPCSTPSECGMHNHDNIQQVENQTDSRQIDSPEHVVSIPLDIEENVSSNEDNFPTNSEEQNTFTPDNDSSDNDEVNNYYIIETACPPSQPSGYKTTQIQNYSRDTIIQEDVDNGWEQVDEDSKPDHGPFMATSGISLDMFTIIADVTNEYAQGKIRSILGKRDHFQQIEHHSHRRHARLSSWKDMNASEIKLFIAYLLVMSSIKKPALHSHWSTTSLSRTPFIGQYLSRNKFQDILWNLHVCDTTLNPPPELLNHDPFAKVRPFIQMCQDNFLFIGQILCPV